MEAEYNYLYEDKYYENAVKNLKSTFYDVVEREEIMLNNLENRIQSQTDENVKARLLDLWSKQNQSHVGGKKIKLPDGLQRSWVKTQQQFQSGVQTNPNPRLKS
jgi:hypothetical protein